MCTCQDPGFGLKDPRLARAEDCVLPSSRCRAQGGLGSRREPTEETDPEIFDLLLGKSQVRNQARHWFRAPLMPLAAQGPRLDEQPQWRKVALAPQSSARLVQGACGGASRTQAAQVSGLAAGAEPTWRRLPRGQTGPSPGGREPETRTPHPHSPERYLRSAWGGHNKVKAWSKSPRREETRRRQRPQKTARSAPRRRQLRRDFG